MKNSNINPYGLLGKAEDVQARFEDGVLTLGFPKEKPVPLPKRKTVQIQG